MVLSDSTTILRTCSDESRSTRVTGSKESKDGRESVGNDEDVGRLEVEDVKVEVVVETPDGGVMDVEGSRKAQAMIRGKTSADMNNRFRCNMRASFFEKRTGIVT